MSEKKSRMLRKMKDIEYNPGEDPQSKRKYAVVVCWKRIGYKNEKPVMSRSGSMVANKGRRLRYRAAKKLYKRGLL